MLIVSALFVQSQEIRRVFDINYHQFLNPLSETVLQGLLKKYGVTKTVKLTKTNKEGDRCFTGSVIIYCNREVPKKIRIDGMSDQ